MFNKAQKTKTTKLARLRNTGKFGCTVSVFIVSVVIVVRLFGDFLFSSVPFCSSAYAMHGDTVTEYHNSHSQPHSISS